MELLKDLTGSLLWATLLSIILYAASSIAIGFLARKSILLKPVGSGLKLIALFAAVQVFLRLGAAEYHPVISRQLDFFSWLVFTFAALKLGLYLYGDLFVVRWKSGSFPAAFKNIITAFILVVVALDSAEGNPRYQRHIAHRHHDRPHRDDRPGVSEHAGQHAGRTDDPS